MTESELRQWLEPQVLPFCGPLFFASSLETAGENVKANGTFGLVDTGLKKLLVTCHHVWEEFVRLESENPQVKFLICLDRNTPVVLHESQMIDSDKDLDIATFDISPLLGACAGRSFYPVHTKPAQPLAKGDKIVLAGYPGTFRRDETKYVQFGRVLYLVSVSDTSGFKIVADISQSAKIHHQQQRKVGENLHGGISGSPCFALKQNILQLAAFATSEGLAGLWFTHASCIGPDGGIRRDPFDD